MPPSPTSVLLRRNRVTELRRSETLVDISQAFTASEELNRSLLRVLEMLERHHDVVKAAFVFRDPDTDELVIEAGIGITPDGLRSRYRIGEGIIGRCAESGVAIRVDDVQGDPRSARRDVDEREGIRSMLCVPLRVAGALLGVISAFSSRVAAFSRTLRLSSRDV